MLTDEERLRMSDAEFFNVTDVQNSRSIIPRSPYRKPSQPKKKQKPEAALQKKIIAWLESQGAIVLRTNSGTFTGASGHRVQGTAAGTSDLTCCWRGKFVSIECKNTGRKATEKQQRYIDRVNATGGLAFVAYSLNEVKQRLAEVME